MAKIEIYTIKICPYCQQAKQLLNKKQVTYHEIAVDQDIAKRDEMIQRSGRKTVPQIFINEQPIGGCDDLYALERAGKLDNLLKENP